MPGSCNPLCGAYHAAMKPTASPLIRRTAAALLLAGMLPAATLAQQPAAPEVLQALQDTLNDTADVSFLATGELHAADGTRYQLEIEVEALPQEQLLRLFILQPDALADNFIIVTPDDLYNYNYLTNQIVVYDSGDPQAYGPLAGDADASFELTLDLGELFAGWDALVTGEVETPDGPAWQLELSNVDVTANITAATLLVLQDSSFPQQVTVITGTGEPLVHIEVSHVEFNTGLTADDLLWYPPDAELIDER